MAIFNCTSCGHTQATSDENSGKKTRCPVCGVSGVVTVEPAKEIPDYTINTAPAVQEASTTYRKSPAKPGTWKSRLYPAAVIVSLASMLFLQCVLIGCVCAVVVQGDTPWRWEYTIASPKDELLDVELSRLGAAGWELVFARRATSDTGPVGYEMILRRPHR